MPDRFLLTGDFPELGVNPEPLNTDLSPRLQEKIRRAALAQIIADLLLSEAGEECDRYFADLSSVVKVAGAEIYDEPGVIEPIWPEEPDDLLKDVVSQTGQNQLSYCLWTLQEDKEQRRFNLNEIFDILEWKPRNSDILGIKRAVEIAVNRAVSID